MTRASLVGMDDELQPISRGDLDARRVGDVGYLLPRVLHGYMTAIERHATPHRLMRFAERLFLMQQGNDPVDEEGRHINDYAHLTSALTRPRDGSRSWIGPVSTASLVRVLEGRVTWSGGASSDTQQTIDVFRSATLVDHPHATIDRVVHWAFDRNSADRYGRGSVWGIDGLAIVERPRREISIDHVRPLDLPVALSEVEEQGSSANPLTGFTNLYERARAEAHTMIFDEISRPNPQVVPRLPGLLLCVALTIEHLTVTERSDDLVPAGLADGTKLKDWNRVAIPALRIVDPDMNPGELATTCRRAAQRFGWLLDIVSSALGDHDIRVPGDEGGS